MANQDDVDYRNDRPRSPVPRGKGWGEKSHTSGDGEQKEWAKDNASMDRIPRRNNESEQEGRSKELGWNETERSETRRERDPIPQSLPELYAIHKAKITALVKYGAFCLLEDTDHVYGLIHLSELSDNIIDRAEDVVQVGDQVWVKVIELIKRKMKVGVSMRMVNQKTGKDLDADRDILDKKLQRFQEKQRYDKGSDRRNERETSWGRSEGRDRRSDKDLERDRYGSKRYNDDDDSKGRYRYESKRYNDDDNYSKGRDRYESKRYNDDDNYLKGRDRYSSKRYNNDDDDSKGRDRYESKRYNDNDGNYSKGRDRYESKRFNDNDDCSKERREERRDQSFRYEERETDKRYNSREERPRMMSKYEDRDEERRGRTRRYEMEEEERMEQRKRGRYEDRPRRREAHDDRENDWDRRNGDRPRRYDDEEPERERRNGGGRR